MRSYQIFAFVAVSSGIKSSIWGMVEGHPVSRPNKVSKG